MKDIRKTMDEGAMAPFQWLAVAICILLIMLDGFDVLVMAFTASAVAAEWKLNGAQLGVLFSAGLIGMAIGSLFLAPVADRRGRQPVIVLCLVVVSVGMLLSAAARSYVELAALRAMTGVGIGGMLASVGVITRSIHRTNGAARRLRCRPRAIRLAPRWAGSWPPGC